MYILSFFKIYEIYKIFAYYSNIIFDYTIILAYLTQNNKYKYICTNNRRITYMTSRSSCVITFVLLVAFDAPGHQSIQSSIARTT